MTMQFKYPNSES